MELNPGELREHKPVAYQKVAGGKPLRCTQLRLLSKVPAAVRGLMLERGRQVVNVAGGNIH